MNENVIFFIDQFNFIEIVSKNFLLIGVIFVSILIEFGSVNVNFRILHLNKYKIQKTLVIFNWFPGGIQISTFLILFHSYSNNIKKDWSEKLLSLKSKIFKDLKAHLTKIFRASSFKLQFSILNENIHKSKL